MADKAETAQITVRYVNPKQPGKKNASIKTNEGDLYFVAPEMLDKFEVGGKYNIQYKVNEFRGTKYNHIESVARIAAPVPNQSSSTHNSITKATFGSVDMETAERIFVCGAINAMLSNQNTMPFTLDQGDIVQRVNILRAVWRDTFGNPQKSADLDDEIPY